MKELKVRLAHLHQEVFSFLRDKNGMSYDQHDSMFDFTDDGEVRVGSRDDSHILLPTPKYQVGASLAHSFSIIL